MRRVKIFLAILCVALIAGCGFRPMHSDGRTMRREMQDIYIAPIAGTNGIDLRNQLIAAWSTSNTPGAKYTLVINLHQPRTILKGLQRTGDATWQEIRMRADWELLQDGKVIAKSTEVASESYTFVADLISAHASHIHAMQNAIQMIGSKIESKVNAKLATRDGA